MSREDAKMIAETLGSALGTSRRSMLQQTALLTGAAATLGTLLNAQGPDAAKGPGGAKGGGKGGPPRIVFTVTSPSFPDGGEVPMKHAGVGENNNQVQPGHLLYRCYAYGGAEGEWVEGY